MHCRRPFSASFRRNNFSGVTWYGVSNNLFGGFLEQIIKNDILADRFQRQSINKVFTDKRIYDTKIK